MPRELAADFRKLGYVAIYVAGFSDGPVRIGLASEPAKRIAELQEGNSRPLTTFLVLWTAGRPVASRIQDEAESLMLRANRRLDTGWHDIPADLARQSVLIAAKKLNLRTFSHAELMARCREIIRDRTQRFVRGLADGNKGLTSGVRSTKFCSRSPEAPPEGAEYAPIDNVSPYIHDDPRREKPGSGRRRFRRDKHGKQKRDHPFR